MKAFAQPSGWITVAMSLGAFLTAAVHLAIFGLARQSAEPATVHIWQLLMAGQIPVVAFFALKWLTQARRAAVLVLGIQLAAWAAALAPVVLLGGL